MATDRPLRVWLGHPLAGYAPTGRRTILQHAVHTARSLVVLDGQEGRVTAPELRAAVSYAHAMGVPRVVLWHDGHPPARLRETKGALVDLVTASAVHRLPVAEIAPEIEGGKPSSA